MLSKPMSRAALFAVVLASGLAAAGATVTVLSGEPGPPGVAPATTQLIAEDALPGLLAPLDALVTAEEAKSFVLVADLPDLTFAVPSDALPDLAPYALKEELDAAYVKAGELPNLAPYLSKGEAEALYLPKSAVPSQEELLTTADLPDTAAFVLASDLGAQTFTLEQLESKLVTKQQAQDTYVSASEPLPGPLADQVRALADQAVLALACPADMVAVGALCIDRVEASVWDAPCGEAGAQRGAALDDYGDAFPDSGAFTAPLFACATPGAMPSRFLTYFQAQQACALSGKRLCTDAEWQTAALGSPDGGCTTGGAAPTATGSSAGCASSAGALDMTGNVREIVADWQQMGPYWKNANGDQTTDWPAGYGDGQDVARGINGTTAEPAKAGLPAMLLRGGSYGDAAAAGPYALSAEAAPTHSDARTGFRCCRSLR